MIVRHAWENAVPAELTAFAAVPSELTAFAAKRKAVLF
jgi:hypothetical protein